MFDQAPSSGHFASKELKGRLLVIDEHRFDAYLVNRLLEAEPFSRYDVHLADAIREGISWLESGSYDAVILNPSSANMPASAALEAVLLRADVTPVVVLLGRWDDPLARQALRMGAQDVLSLGELDPRSLYRALEHAIERQRAVSRLRHERRRAEHFARHEPLTGLPNRSLLMDHARDAFTIADRCQRGVGLLFLDLDEFKNVNDLHGHAVGDRLLQAVAGRLRHAVRSTDMVSRLGGDEFVVVVPDLVHVDDAARVAETIVTRLAEPFEVAGKTLRVTVSVGVALYPGHGRTPEAVLRRADAALYAAKRMGRNTFRVDPEDPAPYSPGRKVRRGRTRPRTDRRRRQYLWEANGHGSV